MAAALERIDQQLNELLGSWNVYSTILASVILLLVIYSALTHQQPDTHPLALSRQSSAGAVRQPRESAFYRSPDIPEGWPLRSGLNVKEKNASVYASGKNGDLRDIWRRIAGQAPPEQATASANSDNSGANKAVKLRIMTVTGRADTIHHDLEEMSREMRAIGEALKSHGQRVAIYLPNSAEFLVTLFACAFYGLDAILVPFLDYGQDVIELLHQTKPDVLIGIAGSLPLESLRSKIKSIKQVIWIVEKSSRQMDWTEVPKGSGGNIEVDAWHELVQAHVQESDVEFADLASIKVGKIITFWQGKYHKDAEVVEFEHQHLVAAIAAMLAVLPHKEAMNSRDLLMPCDSLTDSFVLCWTLAALFKHTSVVLSSVAGPNVDIEVACRNVAPSIIIVSADSAVSLHAKTMPKVNGLLPKLAHSIQYRTLQSGAMPSGTVNLVTQLSPTIKTQIGAIPGRLRLILIAEKIGIDTPPLSPAELSDLRILTGSRVGYALTASKVAGAIAQTHVYDYRVENVSTKQSHFGIPLGSVEVKMVDTPTYKTTDSVIEGQITVRGPAVVGGETRTGADGMMTDDLTLAYI